MGHLATSPSHPPTPTPKKGAFSRNMILQDPKLDSIKCGGRPVGQSLTWASFGLPTWRPVSPKKRGRPSLPAESRPAAARQPSPAAAATPHPSAVQRRRRLLQHSHLGYVSRFARTGHQGGKEPGNFLKGNIPGAGVFFGATRCLGPDWDRGKR